MVVDAWWDIAGREYDKARVDEEMNCVRLEEHHPSGMSRADLYQRATSIGEEPTAPPRVQSRLPHAAQSNGLSPHCPPKTLHEPNVALAVCKREARGKKR